MTDALVGAIGQAFALVDGRPRLADADLARFASNVAALQGERKDDVLAQLVALAKRLWDTDEDAWDDAMMQLCLLVGVGLGDVTRAVDAFAAGGVQVDEARLTAAKVLGTAATLVPVGGPRGEGVVSPLAALLNNRVTKGSKP